MWPYKGATLFQIGMRGERVQCTLIHVGAKANVDFDKLTVWLFEGYIPVRLGPHVQNSPIA